MRRGRLEPNRTYVGVRAFIVVVLENSFKRCAGLIAELLAHEHTLLILSLTHTHALKPLLFYFLYAQISMVTKCTELKQD